MNRTIKTFTLLFIISISFSSCFQFIEEITLQANGSGTMKITLNMSQSKSKLASIMLLDSINNRKVPSRADIQNYLNESVAFLNKSDGISHVKKSMDLTNYILSLSFDFTSVSKINGLSKKMMAKQKTQVPLYTYSYNPGSQLFVRTYQPSSKLKTQFYKLPAKDRNIFNTASFISIQRFSKGIAESKNKTVKISASGKAAMQRVKAMDIISGKADLNNSIQLK